MAKSETEKYSTVVTKNTYYFVNNEFEDRYEGYITSIRDRLLILKNQIDQHGLRIEFIEDLLREGNGLICLLALTGFSNESFKRILTVIRVLTNDDLETNLYMSHWNSYEKLVYSLKLFKDLNIVKNFSSRLIEELNNIPIYQYFDINNLVARSNSIKKIHRNSYQNVLSYCKENYSYKKRDLDALSPDEFSVNIQKIHNYLLSNIDFMIEEWTDEEIKLNLNINSYFVKAIARLFYNGSTITTLRHRLPLFEMKKLSIRKLNFSTDELLDSLVRYKEKGSYSGQKENNPEIVIENILQEMNITFETGDLKDLISNAPNEKRTMDFIIPNKDNPRIIIESSFLVTTSSGQGDKSKTEISIDTLIKNHYPEATFIGFVDGIGWYVRKGDLRRMVKAYYDVFTYHPDEIQRFKDFLQRELL